MTAALPEDIFRPETENENALYSVLILTDNKTEDLEFFYPYYRFIEEGFKVDVATPKGGAFKGKHGTGLKETVSLAQVKIEDYDLLYIPGGKAPSHLKKSEDAVTFTRQFFETGKPIAALCHGPQLLAAAGVVQGKRLAAWPEIEDEITDAGGSFVDAQTVVDGQLITARWPADLPFHLARILELLRSGEIASSFRPTESGKGASSFQ